MVARKYNSNSKTFFDIDGAIIEPTMHQGKPALKLSYAIADNGPLDIDPQVGAIKDPVGLVLREAAGSLASTGQSYQSVAYLVAALIGISGIALLRRNYL